MEEKELQNRPQDVPTPRQLLDLILKTAWEKRGYDTVVLEAGQVIGYTDFMVIMTGRSQRHVTAIAQWVIRELRKQGIRPLGSEGVNIGRWVVLDYDTVVVHIFLSELRALYDLEGLWSDSPKVDIQEPPWVREFGTEDLDMDEDLEDLEDF